MKIAIIAALERELTLLREALQNPTEKTIANMQFSKGNIGNKEIIIAKCGMGKVSAALVTQIAIDYYQPDLIINTGCAGALANELNIGDIVIANSLVEWDLDTTEIGTKKSWIQELDMVELYPEKILSKKIKLCLPQDTHSVEGLIVSGDRFVASKEITDYIFKYFPNAMCAEMEGAAIAHVATQNQIDFCVIRTMSDTADGKSKVDYWEFSQIAGEKSAKVLLNLFENL